MQTQVTEAEIRSSTPHNGWGYRVPRATTNSPGIR
jgi:hypothetical protein